LWDGPWLGQVQVTSNPYDISTVRESQSRLAVMLGPRRPLRLIAVCSRVVLAGRVGDRCIDLDAHRIVCYVVFFAPINKMAHVFGALLVFQGALIA
jgi:hypothetical protein